VPTGLRAHPPPGPPPVRRRRAPGSTICCLTAQDARVRGDTHNDVPREPTMCGRLATAMTTVVSRQRSAPDGDNGDNDPMWSLEFASSWARLDAAHGYHALA
jgi:hypothetical protein